MKPRRFRMEYRTPDGYRSKAVFRASDDAQGKRLLSRLLALESALLDPDLSPLAKGTRVHEHIEDILQQPGGDVALKTWNEGAACPRK